MNGNVGVDHSRGTAATRARPPEVDPVVPALPPGAAPVPAGRPVRLRRVRAALKHPGLSPYVRLGAAVATVNVVLAVVLGPSWAGAGAVRVAAATSDLALVNLALAVLMRQRLVVNALFRTMLRIPRSWPYTVRWSAGKVSHFGGVHVGAASSGVGWHVVSTVALFVAVAHGTAPAPAAVLPGMIAVALVAVVACAVRPVRERWHDLFERTHRWLGWGLLILMVGNTAVVTWAVAGGSLLAVLGAWQVWVVAVVVLSAAWPWTTLRRVPITTERLSSHAISVRFPQDRWTPLGSFVSFSRSPLTEWHSFAIIGPGDSGEGRVVVSRAGDWTGAFIESPPTHLWLKGRPTAGMGSASSLFDRVLFVATGSGIGPLFSVMELRELPFRLLWVTRDPVATYGAEFVEHVRRIDPGAVVWDTTRDGKPDTLALTRRLQLDFDAHAVVCVSNKKLTWAVVGGMERQGVAAYGAIFDS
ncbi:hypothetical protein [Pseudonocardia sp. HH130630-07]|uniref:hypothetical protein n=1 Tax=Pseudonocardia sp. HH130630-07 TaxID=1690815 RepID=UPI0008152089|nr:hypothetical protein [Pseudonocardia sp. HH130630-07]ANY08978.1 hypothetical protein AFB00_24960 [Pseudonocardia sp. HH130630-07]